MKMILDPTFYVPLFWGLCGLLLWICKTWYDPTDDTITGTFTVAFKSHSRTLLVSLISYIGLCVVLKENDSLTKVAAFAGGYMNQSLWQAAMDTVSAKFQGKIGG